MQLDTQMTASRGLKTAIHQIPRVIATLWGSHPVATIMLPTLMATMACGAVLQPYLNKVLVDGVEVWVRGDVSGGRRLVLIAVGSMLAARLAMQVLETASRLVEHSMRFHLGRFIQERILRCCISVDIGTLESVEFNNSQERAQQDAAGRVYGILMAFAGIVRQGVVLIGFLGVLASLAWWLAPAVLALILPAVVAEGRFGRARWALAYQQSPKHRQLGYLQGLLCSTYSAKELRLFGTVPYLLRQWQRLAMGLYRDEFRMVWRAQVWTGALGMLNVCLSVVFCGYVAHRAATDPSVTIGSMVMYITALTGFAGAAVGLSGLFNSLYESSLYIGNLFELIAVPSTITSPVRPEPMPDVREHPIRLENVCFGYPGAARGVFAGLNLEIAPGQTLAVVGENGAGKTTLVKLLTRLYDPQRGRITVGGVDLRCLDLDRWRSQIGVVLQDYVQYYLSARENIGLGDIGHIDDVARIGEAAEEAGIAERLMRLKGGWDALLGPGFGDGNDLSIGEWQRLAVARAFFRDAPLLIMDEPTASLDAHAEYDLVQRLQELMRGRTTILISHRLSTVRLADRIIVLDSGTVVEDGTHEELIEAGGMYADMFNRQAAAYV